MQIQLSFNCWFKTSNDHTVTKLNFNNSKIHCIYNNQQIIITVIFVTCINTIPFTVYQLSAIISPRFDRK